MATPQPGKLYELAGESAALYNGAQDTDGGIWLRIRDENDRRILGAAIDKQAKNQQAAQGTLVALDPNAGHLVDYVGAALERIRNSINGARPPESQLDGTPIGSAIAGSTSSAADGDAAEGKSRGKRGRGGKASTVGEVLAQVPGSPLAPPTSDTSGDGSGIQWADHVPNPRPKPADMVRTPEGHGTSITKVIGFDGGTGAFRVIDADGWDGLVVSGAGPGEWYIMGDLLRYPATFADVGNVGEPTATNGAAGASSAGDDFPADALSDTPDDTPDDAIAEAAAGTAAEAGGELAHDGGTSTAVVPPQRKRNAAHAGLGRAEPVAKKAAAAKPAGKRGRKSR